MTDWLSGVDRQDFGTTGGSWTGGPAKIVVHTTETTGWPGYQGGATCPHFTVRWTGKALEVRQHVSLGHASRALKNLAGGVQTNRDSAIQVEVIGTCDRGGAAHRAGAFLWDDAPDEALAALGGFLRRLAGEARVPLHVMGDWVDYPASYGFRAAQRMSLSEWDNFSGICGHQHVPENDHGDPGAMKVAHAIALASGTTPPVVVTKPTPWRPPHVTGGAPRFPLPHGAYFGPKSGPANSRSGYYGAADRAGLRTWQAQMRRRGWTIAVDGLYGPQTAKVARAFQAEKRLAVDGLIGPATWAAAWTAPVT